MKKFFENAAMQNNPLGLLSTFLGNEKRREQARDYENLRFVGYVLDIGYYTVTIITSDPYKKTVGGVPRNSLLIMTPSNYDEFPPHFTLLRVLEAAPTPLTREVQQTYFELQKRSMPELDVFTQSELQWGALKTEVIGMFYPHPESSERIEFSGDINNFVSAHKYRVYAPDDSLLDLIVNSMVPLEDRFEIGSIRLTECRMPLPTASLPDVRVYISPRDFMGTRTAMFGKTRLGKSNIVKLIAQSLIETTADSKNVGQLIFDINGEYANDNPQDESHSLNSCYPDRCIVYAVTRKPNTESRPLKINFYEKPDKGHKVLRSLLEEDRRTASYVKKFASAELLSIEEIGSLPPGGDKIRSIRKIHFFWAILSKAGYSADEDRLRSLVPHCGNTAQFNPGFSAELREAAYSSQNISPVPSEPATLSELTRELEIVNRFRRSNSGHSALTTQNDKPLFEADDIGLLDFLEPPPGWAGTGLIMPYRMYHDTRAGDYECEVLSYLDQGNTIILDLGNANPILLKYFSDELSHAVFSHQVDKFTSNQLGDHYVQLYFEEAHNLFPKDDIAGIYSRFAKEGAKYHIGMVYSTQSPTTISGDLLAQTENFFVAHLSSRDEANALGKLNVLYENQKEDILRVRTVGYVRMLTRSHRFTVPVQARKFLPRASNTQVERNAV